VRAEYIAAAKEARIAKDSVVKILPSIEDFKSIVGLDRLKSFAKKMVLSGQGRGILLLGVPGSGKSAFSATLGRETNRTTLSLDFATLMGGIVGETESKTERALKLVNAMQPCILFIDEIEKGLAGTSGYNGDSGTARRQGSLFLKWLSDHTTDVYVVATANQIQDLPPEFKRAERWDAIFFVDIPHPKQAQAILKHYAKKYGIKESLTKLDVVGLTGAEIKSMCRMASAMKCSLTDAKQFVKPIADSMDIESFRGMARTCAIPADEEYLTDDAVDNVGKSHTRKLMI
jgi:SpoVK/Ycf46/Vps4 family AAA+-type ATPase